MNARLGRLRSYGDALRLFNDVVDLIRKVEQENSWREHARNALIKALQAIILLVGGGYRPPSDVTYLAAQAVEAGAIGSDLYSRIVEANLVLNGYAVGGREFVVNVIKALMSRAEELDSYLNQQMSLYRY